MTTRAGHGAAGAVLVVILAACGQAAHTTQIGAGAPTSPTSGAPTSGRHRVTFGAATFDVPAQWPVYDLTASPHRCARFDVHAVYLHHQAADATCPARALGKTEAVQVEANDAYAQARVLPSPSAAPVNGQAVAYEPGGEANHQIVATFPGLGVVVRVTYGPDAGAAQQIVASVRKSAP
ncbi:MAG: hypothetical protein M3256_16250 [Actinomycetota bacterium]|nr:hypothetical protein [Actinomycetota bacterium]